MRVGKISLVSILCTVFCILAVTACPQNALAATTEETICDGVYIDDIDISGMTRAEAKDAIDSYIEGLQQKKVSISVDGDTISQSLEELGYTCDENTYIEEAMQIGKSGNLIARYKALKDAEHNGQHYTLSFTLDTEKLQKFVEKECASYDIPAVNAGIKRVNGTFQYSDESVGRKIDAAKTVSEITDTLSNDWDHNDIAVDAIVIEDIPTVTREMAEKCNTLLGTFTTNYATSTQDRKGNVANGARLINNSVVYPGEVFSCYEVMHPFTLEHGYYSAGAYVNGMVEDSIGGGVCQVSTTLYNAVLKAELEIVQRQAHSMIVSYVPLAQDAAIAGTYKDLKFKNNTEVPILIEGITNGSTITFNVYGQETRDTATRTVKYESVTVSQTNPPADVITKDPTQPTSYRRVTQSAHTGYVAELYKVVYENGVETSRTLVNKSVYSASPNYITVGSKVEEVKEDPEDKDETKDEEDTDKKKDESTEDTGKKPDKEDSNKGESDKKDENTSTEDTKKDEESDDEKDTSSKKEKSTETSTDQKSGDEESKKDTQ